MIIDKLIDRIVELKNPTVVGLDSCVSYLPNSTDIDDNFKAGMALVQFNKAIIDKIYPYVPAVKVQVAYYEQYGVSGFDAFYETIAYAKTKGLFVIADIKRNDISSTAKAYSNAYLGRNDIFQSGFYADFITINGYLGSDGVIPFIEDCVKFDKGLFVLVRTSNPSGKEIQCLKLEDGRFLYEEMGRKVEEWGQCLTGRYGYSSIGGVVGGTHKEECETLRKELRHTFFLIPGYGAQGGNAEMLKGCFDERGIGGIVNSSRGILCAYKNERYKGNDFATAAKLAVLDMQKDLVGVLGL